MLKKLTPPTGVAAVFEDESLRVGRMTVRGTEMLGLFNWTDEPIALSTRVARACRVRDFWSGEDLGRRDPSTPITIKDMPPHSARLLECANA